MKKPDSLGTILMIVLIGIYLFFPFLGSVHLFDWDEINFAESAREMLLTNNYFRVQIDFKPFWEKPPLFFWMQALSMRIFGINEFAARFPNAVCGLLTLVIIFLIGKKIFSKRLAMLWVLAYIGSFLPHLYFKSGIIDPFFNLFIFLGIYFLSQQIPETERRKRLKGFLLAGFFIGLGILTKGPVALLVTLLSVTVYWLLHRFKAFVNIKEIFAFTLICIFISFAWFGLETLKNGAWFLKEFITYQIELFSKPVAGHGQPFYYHFLVLLIGCFPASVFAIQGFKRDLEDSAEQQNFRQWMLLLFWVVLILFSIVTTKIVHYSSLCYFPLTFLAAYAMNKLLDKKRKSGKLQGLLLLFLGLLIGLAFTALPLLAIYKDFITPFIKDSFMAASLEANVMWSGYEPLLGIAYIVLIISAAFMLLKNNIKTGILMFFISTAFFLQIYTAIVVPKIEQYSQGSAILFYQSLKGEDCYVYPLGFKTYAHYFYFEKMPPKNPESYNEEWLLKGPIDKPVYFISKNTYAKEIRNNYPSIQETGRNGGFIFFKRIPVNIKE